MSKDEQKVLDYLEKMNRPYSVNDILQNLHNEVTKAAVQKTLDQLVSKGKIREKIYNKQKIYTVVQETNQNKNTQEELQRLETEILEKSEVLKKLEQELKSVETSLGGFQSALTTEEAVKKKSELQSCVASLKTKLSSLSENRELISKVDRDKLEKSYDTTVKAYRKRKRICMDIFNSILENYPKSKLALIEEIGLEMDDDTNTPSVLRI